ncbi:phospholipase D-like domain-containing protein [Priestia sp. TRN 1309]|uniref:phospholipase D-like domain-containing protein n=1 Tax=Priestia sp. TRN 1309 TaxID=3420729 RepID=UPI003D780697
MVKKMLFILVCGLCLCLFFQWDVKKGYNAYVRVHPLIETPVYQGNIALYTKGSNLYPTLFEDIKKAKKYVYIQFFIIRADNISMKLFELLKEKAAEGVKVKLSVDRFGGNDLSRTLIDDLKKNGVEFTFSRKASRQHFFYSINHRNHRKFVVVDGQEAYLGGFNIGEEYLGKHKKLGYWRDYHLRIKGEGIFEIEKQFLKDWEEDTGQHISPQRVPIARSHGASYQLLFSTGEELEQKMIDLINRAKVKLTIATPYFIPSEHLMNALISAKEKGVLIDIILPDNTDAWFTKPPSYPKTEQLLNKGIRIFLYKKGFFHGKVMVIDHTIANISTANWDPRSFYLNDEASCLIYDREMIAHVEREINEDKTNSRRLTKTVIDEIPKWERSLKKTPEWIYYYF